MLSHYLSLHNPKPVQLLPFLLPFYGIGFENAKDNSQSTDIAITDLKISRFGLYGLNPKFKASNTQTKKNLTNCNVYQQVGPNDPFKSNRSQHNNKHQLLKQCTKLNETEDQQIKSNRRQQNDKSQFLRQFKKVNQNKDQESRIKELNCPGQHGITQLGQLSTCCSLCQKNKCVDFIGCPQCKLFICINCYIHSKMSKTLAQWQSEPIISPNTPKSDEPDLTAQLHKMFMPTILMPWYAELIGGCVVEMLIGCFLTFLGYTFHLNKTGK